MPSLSCCGGVMKRQNNGVGVMGEEEEDNKGREEKRSRMEENGGNKVEGEEVKIASKCPICLWPAGAPECYHTAAGNTSQTEL